MRQIALAMAALIAACSSTPPVNNQAIDTINASTAYRSLDEDASARAGDTVIFMAFSGGGTRAAALSYGVLQEMLDTRLINGDGETRLIDEIDVISSVSGGSFTSAYYGLFGDRIFKDFEDVFLRRNVQGALITRVTSPAQLTHKIQGLDRTENAVAYYDSTIFEGATFKDMRSDGPLIEINATDLGSGHRFSFTQERFNAICTDLDSFAVARAVTASSAVPVVFPTVVLKNHADQCDVTQSEQWQFLLDAKHNAETASRRELAAQLLSYRDAEKRRYIHLVDGGVSDNLGIRALTERVEVFYEEGLSRLRGIAPSNILIILVNAEVKPERHIEETMEKPSPTTTLSAMTATQMGRYNEETLDRLNMIIRHLENKTDREGTPTRVYFAEVAFDNFDNPEISRFYNSLPTTFKLSDDEIDRLILAGRLLLRHDDNFEQFRQDNGAFLPAETVSTDDLCRHFEQHDCAERLFD